MDAFRNYDQLLNSMGEANADKNAALNQMNSTKASIDSTMKVLGETKLALSSRSAVQGIGKKFIKPRLKKYFSKKAEELENKIKNAASKSGTDEGTYTINGNSTPTTKSPTPADEDTGYADVDDYTPPGGFSETIGDGSVESNAINDTVGKGASRASKFEKNVSSGEAEGTEDDFTTGGVADKTDFTSSDIGEAGDNVYSRTNGLSEEETGQVNDFINKSVVKPNPSGGATEAEANASRGAPTQASGNLAEDTPKVGSPSQNPVKDLGKKQLKKSGEKDLEEEGGDLAAEEGGLATLDAIPFADIIGVIGGAVLAGVEGHKQNKAQKAMEDGSNPVIVSSQAGLGGSEAN